MTREEVIRMARSAGFLRRQITVYNCECMERFAALVAAAERDACAQIVESVDNYANPLTASDCAAAIRARGGEMSLEEMWARLAQHQPFADRRGYGPEWARMCAERSEAAAWAAARAADGEADAARARLAWSRAADIAAREAAAAAREAAAAAWAAADAAAAWSWVEADEAVRWVKRSEEQK